MARDAERGTLDRKKVESHLLSVYRYNVRHPLRKHANLMFSNLAGGEESGIVVCTWPQGARPTLPLIYSDEVLSGSEYAVASHLILHGHVEKGLQVVRASRQRYDGRIRNPFGESEAGHWYARSMASYGLLQALSGARFDAVNKTLYLHPAIKGDFRSFLCTATGYGTVGVKNGKPFVEVVSGRIPYERIAYRSA